MRKMKNNHFISIAAFALAFLGACAENNLADFKVEKPEDIAVYEYLNEYSTLKTYIENSTTPSFKLGAAVNADEYAGGGILYSLVSSNFNEITPKDVMQHSACVQSDGTMDFLNVKQLLESAQNAGTSVYGNGLCNYTDQNITYLNNLLADRPLPDEETQMSVMTRAGGMKRVYLVNTDFENGLTVEGGSWSAWGDAIKNHGNYWKVVDGEGYGGSKGYKINVGSGYAASKGQTVVQFSPEIPAVENTTYYLNLKVRASHNCSITSEFRKNGSSSAIGKFNPAIDVTTEWQEVTVSCPSVSGNIYRFYLNVGTVDGTIWFDDLSVYYEIPGGIPQTPEEMADTLTWEMDRWICGMMEACNGIVTDWNVVNEPLATVDEDGYYDLRSASQGDDASLFYWKDYLGEDYPRLVVSLARKYGPSEMKLYINESDLAGDATKLNSLIHWIERWESDGQTRIDGISTTMHLSFMLDEVAQQQQEATIRSTFAQLAATGKLIRISALDMNIVDVSGTEISTLELTFEQEQLMADFYTFVLSAYAELIPSAQQGGITQWTLTGVNHIPSGLWSEEYLRCPAYAGFAEGLQVLLKY